MNEEWKRKRKRRRRKRKISKRDRTKVDFHGVDVRLIIYALSGVNGLMVIKEGVLQGCTLLICVFTAKGVALSSSPP